MKTTKQNIPNWHLIGIGALGSLIARFFAQRQIPLNLIFKDKKAADVFIKNGLVIKLDGSIDFYPASSQLKTQLLADYHSPSKKIDYLIICVKAYDVLAVLKQLQSALHEKSIIILIVNGLNILNQIHTRFPLLRIISGVSTLGAYRDQDQSIKIFLGGKLFLGPSLGKFTDQEIQEVKNIFETIALPYEWKTSITSIQWEKFAINCAINVLTVFLNCRNGELLNHPNVLHPLVFEIAHILQAYDIPITGPQLLTKVTQVLTHTRYNYSSMYMDVKQNKPTELVYLNQYLLALAEKKNVGAWINLALLRTLRP